MWSSGGRGRGGGKKLRANPFRRFVFDLASELGMSPGEVLAKHDSDELTEWMAYATLPPNICILGHKRADARMARLAYFIVSLLGDGKTPVKETDFFFKGATIAEATPEQAVAYFQALFGSGGNEA